MLEFMEWNRDVKDIEDYTETTDTTMYELVPPIYKGYSLHSLALTENPFIVTEMYWQKQKYNSD